MKRNNKKVEVKEIKEKVKPTLQTISDLHLRQVQIDIEIKLANKKKELLNLEISYANTLHEVERRAKKANKQK
jgi:hypothetical protein